MWENRANDGSLMCRKSERSMGSKNRGNAGESVRPSMNGEATFSHSWFWEASKIF